MKVRTAGNVAQLLGFLAMIAGTGFVVEADLVDRAAETARVTQQIPGKTKTGMVLLGVGLLLAILGTILRWVGKSQHAPLSKDNELHIGTVAAEDQRAREIASLQQEVASLKRDSEKPRQPWESEPPPPSSGDPEQMTPEEAAREIQALHRDAAWSKRFLDGDRAALKEMERLRRIADSK